MSFFDGLKILIKDYFIIYTGSILGTLAFCTIFYPEATFTLDYFKWILLFALIGDLPQVILFSRHELTTGQLNIRIALHFIILEALLLTASNLLGMWETPFQGVIFSLIILTVYAMVRLVNFLLDTKTATEINEKLKSLT